MTFSAELSFLMKTFLCRPAYDKDVSYSVWLHGSGQLFSQISFSLDVPNVSVWKTIFVKVN